MGSQSTQISNPLPVITTFLTRKGPLSLVASSHAETRVPCNVDTHQASDSEVPVTISTSTCQTSTCLGAQQFVATLENFGWLVGGCRDRPPLHLLSSSPASPLLPPSLPPTPHLPTSLLPPSPLPSSSLPSPHTQHHHHQKKHQKLKILKKKKKTKFQRKEKEKKASRLKHEKRKKKPKPWTPKVTLRPSGVLLVFHKKKKLS